MSQQHSDEQIGAYVLGALEPDEIAAVEAHLESCARCRERVAAARADADLLLLTAPPVTPPPALRDRVLARVHAAAFDDAPAIAAAPPHQGGIRQALRSLLGGAGEGDPAATMLAKLMARPECAIWPVAPTEAAPGASARLVGVPGGRDAVLVVAGLAPLAADHVYQIWLLRGGKPVPNALFRIRRDGQGLQIVRAPRRLGDFGVVAVTPEPAGGSAAPTGAIVLMGELSA